MTQPAYRVYVCNKIMYAFDLRKPYLPMNIANYAQIDDEMLVTTSGLLNLNLGPCIGQEQTMFYYVHGVIDGSTNQILSLSPQLEANVITYPYPVISPPYIGVDVVELQMTVQDVLQCLRQMTETFIQRTEAIGIPATGIFINKNKETLPMYHVQCNGHADICYDTSLVNATLTNDQSILANIKTFFDCVKYGTVCFNGDVVGVIGSRMVEYIYGARSFKDVFSLIQPRRRTMEIIDGLLSQSELAPVIRLSDNTLRILHDFFKWAYTINLSSPDNKCTIQELHRKVKGLNLKAILRFLTLLRLIETLEDNATAAALSAPSSSDVDHKAVAELTTDLQTTLKFSNALCVGEAWRSLKQDIYKSDPVSLHIRRSSQLTGSRTVNLKDNRLLALVYHLLLSYQKGSMKNKFHKLELAIAMRKLLKELQSSRLTFEEAKNIISPHGCDEEIDKLIADYPIIKIMHSELFEVISIFNSKYLLSQKDSETLRSSGIPLIFGNPKSALRLGITLLSLNRSLYSNVKKIDKKEMTLFYKDTGIISKFHISNTSDRVTHIPYHWCYEPNRLRPLYIPGASYSTIVRVTYEDESYSTYHDTLVLYIRKGHVILALPKATYKQVCFDVCNFRTDIVPKSTIISEGEQPSSATSDYSVLPDDKPISAVIQSKVKDGYSVSGWVLSTSFQVYYRRESDERGYSICDSSCMY